MKFEVFTGLRCWASIGILKHMLGNFSTNWWRKICFMQCFSEKKICLLCISFRGNFLKYLLSVGVKSECSKRPQSMRLDGCCQQRDHKKSCNWPIINTEQKKDYAQETLGIWFKPTKVKKFRHESKTSSLCQIALTYDVCVVSAPESTEECQVWLLGPSLPNKENSVC